MSYDNVRSQRRRDLPENNSGHTRRGTQRKRSRSPTTSSSWRRVRSRSREQRKQSDPAICPDLEYHHQMHAAYDSRRPNDDDLQRRTSKLSKFDDRAPDNDHGKSKHSQSFKSASSRSSEDFDGKRKAEHIDKADAVIKEQPKQLPDFGLSGKLLADTNKVRGTIVKYAEPPEARKPKARWRIYVFKDTTMLETLHVYRQSSYLFGRDRNVADIPLDHPSCSKQHAVLQFRAVNVKDKLAVGPSVQEVKPYIIDLGSANGTFINKKQIDSQRYVELLVKDVLNFGFSTRDYVVVHDDVIEAEHANAEDSSVNEQILVSSKQKSLVESGADADDEDEQNLGLPEIPDVDKIKSEVQQKLLQRLKDESLTDFY